MNPLALTIMTVVCTAITAITGWLMWRAIKSKEQPTGQN